jgi:error-prone DNA polymerase
MRDAYAELVAASNFSFLRGASHPEELVETALRLGLAGIGMADRNSVAGVVRAFAALKALRGQTADPALADAAKAFRLIVGARLAFTDTDLEIVAYPRDRAAWGRLTRLLTCGNTRAVKGQCLLTIDDLLAHVEGLQLIAIAGRRPEAEHLAVLHRLKTAVGDHLHLGIALAHAGDDQRRLVAFARVADRLSLPLLAIGDVLYHDPARRRLADVMTAIREKTTVRAAGYRLVANAERHLKPTADMAHLFKGAPGGADAMIAATWAFLSRISFDLGQLSYDYPDEPVPAGSTPDAHLADLTWAGARVRYPAGIPDKVRATLVKELALIAQRRYAAYFLTVHDIVAYARTQGILCQGRGSAANSAVCFVLGITGVDPASTDLLFERFISQDRSEPPDIDVDFEHERREDVIQYIYNRYGRHRAALCATVISYRARSAIREVGKVLGLSEDITTALASTIWGSSGQPISDPRVRQAGLDPTNPAVVEAVSLAGELIGFPRHLSQHVGGFILTRDRLDETVPIGNGAMADRTFIEWDKDDIDTLDIMKVDVLALGMLTCIRKAFDLIAETEGITLTLADLPREDPETYKMLSRGDSIGVFQVESRAQMNMLPRLKPVKFYDLVIEVAIVRPGPIQGDMVHPYLRNRQRPDLVDYPRPGPGEPQDELENVLQKTLGVPLFQEQAMRIAMVAAKFSGSEANQLRRAMATFRRTGTIHTFHDKMVEGMVARGYKREFAERCFKQIEGFGEYGFPESHAAAFAHLVYVSSYLKRHHPAAFAAALLNAQPMGFYAPAQIVRDAREHGVPLLDIDVNTSYWDNSLTWSHAGSQADVSAHLQAAHMERSREAIARAERQAAYVAGGGRMETYVDPVPPRTSTPPATWGRSGPALRLGFRQIDGFREDWGEAIVTNRGAAPYDRPEALMRRAVLPKSALQRLADADTFRSMGLDRREAAWGVRRLPDDDALPLFAAARTRELGEEAPSLLPLMSAPEQVAADYRTINLSLKAHPVSFLRAQFTRDRVRTCADVACLRHNSWTNVAGVVLVRQRPGTAKGVVFITIEDETGICNLVVWPKMMDKFRREVMAGRLIEARGPIQRSPEGVVHLIVKHLVDRTALLYGLAEGATPLPLARADEVARPDSRADVPPPRHPRHVRILPKSRDFH